MKRIVSCLWLAGLIAVAGAQGDPKKIEPGKQLGKLSIGDLMEDMKWLKKPDYGDAASGHVWQTWEAKKPDPRNGKIINSLDVYTTVNDAGKNSIEVIRSTSPTFATKDKIKVGSTFSEVKEKFPKIAKLIEYQSPQFAAKVALYDDQTAGVGFEFKVGADGTVGRHEKCLSAWVHEPKLDLLNQYYAPVPYLTGKPGFRQAAKHAKD